MILGQDLDLAVSCIMLKMTLDDEKRRVCYMTRFKLETLASKSQCRQIILNFAEDRV